MRLLIVTQKVDKEDDILGFFHRWIEEFALYSSDLTVIALSVGNHTLPEHVKVISLGKPAQEPSRIRRVHLKLLYVVRFVRAIVSERTRYDVAFVHMVPVFVIVGWLPWRLLRKKILLWYTHKSVDLKLRFAERMVDQIFTASRDSFRLPSNKVRVVGHGIDPDEFRPGSGDGDPKKLSVLTVGRLSRIKDYETIIDAIGLVRDHGYPVQLTVVGGPTSEDERCYEQELKERVQNKKLNDTVVFVGTVPHTQVKHFLKDADVFVNTSNTGSLDKAVLEAMSAGIIPITTNIAFRDLLGEYAHQLMASPGDAQKLSELLLDLHQKGYDPALELFMRDQIKRFHSVQELVPRLVGRSYDR